MRINIKQCRFCPIKSDCDHKKNIQSELKGKLIGLHFNHNCTEYKNVVKPGTMVRFAVNDQIFVNQELDLGGGELLVVRDMVRWEKQGDFEGIITGYVYNNLYEIRLFQPVKVQRLDKMNPNQKVLVPIILKSYYCRADRFIIISNI